jgi:hypothetical protein
VDILLTQLDLSPNQKSGHLIVREMVVGQGMELLVIENDVYYSLVSGPSAQPSAGNQVAYIHALISDAKRKRVTFADWVCLGRWQLERKGRRSARRGDIWD